MFEKLLTKTLQDWIQRFNML